MKTLSGYINKIEQYFVGILILIITAVLFANVVLRYFNMSFDWADEFSRYGIVWVTFIGASICVYKGAHIGVDAILMLLPDTGKKIVAVVTTLIALAFAILFTYQASKLTLQVMETGQISSTLKVSMVYIYGAMPIGGALLTIRYLQQLVLEIGRLKGGKTV